MLKKTETPVFGDSNSTVDVKNCKINGITKAVTVSKSNIINLAWINMLRIVYYLALLKI
jgi:hypothetical protein